MTESNPAFEDRLTLATRALCDIPITGGPPADLLVRLEQIQNLRRPNRTMTLFRWASVAASLLVIFGGVMGVWLFQHSSDIAFADVVQKIDQTHTFTAVCQVDQPDGSTARSKIFAKDRNLRIESADLVQIINQDTGQVLQLQLSKHLAITKEHTFYQQLDLYGMLRNYHGGNEQPLGEKTIDGQVTQGFRTIETTTQEPTIVWANPSTKLPVEVEIGSAVMTDLHFDLPLEDGLFDTHVPAGYTSPSEAVDSWDELKFSGQVLDERGQPIARVYVDPSDRLDPLHPKGYGFAGEPVETGSDGRFTIDGGQIDPASNDPVRIEFKHPEFLYGRVEDLHLLSPQARMNLQVRLRRGKNISGKVVDAKGQPVVGALIETVYGNSVKGSPEDSEVRFDYGKFVQSDDHGNFQLHGLATGPVLLQARKFPGAGADGGGFMCGQLTVDPSLPASSATTIVLTPLAIPAGQNVHELFGMKLIDVNDEIKNRLSLTIYDRVMILDPGRNCDRLGIGSLETSDAFWMVGETRIKDFGDFAKHLLIECERQQGKGRTQYVVRVVYDYTRLKGAWSNTQYMYLDDKDVAELKKVLSQRRSKRDF